VAAARSVAAIREPRPAPAVQGRSPSWGLVAVGLGAALLVGAALGSVGTYLLVAGKGSKQTPGAAAPLAQAAPPRESGGDKDSQKLPAEPPPRADPKRDNGRAAEEEQPPPEPEPKSEPRPVPKRESRRDLRPPAPPGATADAAVKNGEELPRKAVVGKPFTYQLSTEKGKATYGPVSLPKDVSVSADGLVRWTPGPGTAGTHDLLLQVNGREFHRYKIVVEEAPESGIALLSLPTPGGWVMTPDNVTLIVSLPEQAQLAYLDTVANKEVKRVEVDFQPGALALQGDTLFAAARGSSQVYALEARTGKVKRSFDAGSDAIAHLACHPSRGLVYASTTKWGVYSIDPASGAVSPTGAKGFFLAVDPLEGKYVYTGMQPPTLGDDLIVEDLPGGKIKIYWDRWGKRAVLMKYAVQGKELKYVSGQNNAAVNGWDMHLTPDGKRVMLVGGGGWRPKGQEGNGGGYVVALYNTDNLETMVGQAPHGLDIAFHPVLNLGVTNHYGTALTVFHANSLTKRLTIPVSKAEERRPLLLTFGGKGTKVILWNGDNVKNRQGLHFIPLDLKAEEREALEQEYGPLPPPPGKG
jgi:hypothetical protein